MNHAFEAGNIGPEDRIERLAQMHSVSVGDVLVDDEGAWLVMSLGYGERMNPRTVRGLHNETSGIISPIIFGFNTVNRIYRRSSVQQKD